MRDIDHGWAWVVMMAAFSTQFITGVLSYSVGVFHNALLNEFKEDLTFTSLVGSVYTSLLCLTGPLVSFVINKWSCRVATITSGCCLFSGFSLSFFAPNLIVLLVTYGVIAGIGLGFSAISAVIVVGYSFEKYRGIAVGVNVAGAGIGMFAGGPFIQYLIDQYSLRGAMLILGAFGGQAIVFGALMRPTEIEMSYKTTNEKSDSKKKRSHFQCSVFRNKSFLCILVASFFWNVPYNILFIHLPRFSVEYGATDMQAAFLITMIGLGSTLNRLLAGLVLGPGGIDPLLLNFGFLGIFGLTTVTFPLYSAKYIGQSIYSFVTGIYSGGLIVLINPLCCEIVGISQLSSAVGFYFTLAGIACILGGPLAGALIELGVSYEGVFFLSGTLCILGAFVSLCASFWHGNPNTKEKATSFVDFKESRFLSGSAYLSGSFTVIVEDDKKTQLRKSRDSIMSKTPNGYSESVESLFMDRNGLPNNHYLSPHRALDNSTPGTIKKWLTRPERSSDQSLSCSGLQIQEIRLLSDEESVN